MTHGNNLIQQQAAPKEVFPERVSETAALYRITIGASVRVQLVKGQESRIPVTVPRTAPLRLARISRIQPVMHFSAALM
jgi:hypothetical protein